MTEPKRAEPNEHARELRRIADFSSEELSDYSTTVEMVCDEAAGEIERLQNRIWEIQHYPEILQEAQLRPAYVPTIPPKVLGYDVLVDGKPVAVLKPEDVPTDRPWITIESAPRDGTRVELWFTALPGGHRDHAAYGSWIERGGYWISDSGVRMNEPTHWRREPAGPSASPPLPSG